MLENSSLYVTNFNDYRQFPSFSKLTIIVNLGRLDLARDYGKLIYLYIFFVRRSVCHMVSIRKREDPGNECLCVVAITLLGRSAVAIW